VASIGTNYLVAWSDERSRDTDSDIYAARVAGSGAVLDPDGVPCAPARAPSSTQPGRRTGRLSAGLEDRGQGEQLSSARLSPQGAVLDMWGVGLAGSGDRTAPALAYGGANKYLLVNEAFRNNSQRIAANLVSSEPPSKYALVQFARPAPTVAENGRFAKITVRLKGAYSGVVTVDFTTTDRHRNGRCGLHAPGGTGRLRQPQNLRRGHDPIVDDRVRIRRNRDAHPPQNPVGRRLVSLEPHGPD